MWLVVAIGGTVGLGAGLLADAWLGRRTYRYDDECGFPVRSSRWLIPVLAVLIPLCLVGWWPMSVPTAILLAGYTIVLGVLSAIDLDVRRLPDKITLPSVVVTLVAVVVVSYLNGTPGDAVRSVSAGLALGAFYFVQVLIGRGRGMGLGDVKLALSLGMVLGLLSWPHVLVATIAGYLTALAMGITLIAFKGANRKTEIAFGPHMALGTVLILSVPGVLAIVSGGLG